MRPLRTRLEEARKRLGAPWEVLERDYVVSWILAGIAGVETLSNSLVFKGGTALKKCYFGDYRFSEDLDFTAIPPLPRSESLERAITKACALAEQLVHEYAPVRIVSERYTEREPHPFGQKAFILRAQLPWHREPRSRVLVEITTDESVLRSIDRRPVLHEYGESLDVNVVVYGLEEIVAEKLRGILQHSKILEERGWTRSCARDFYDIWRILGIYRDSLDLKGFRELLQEKCAQRNVSFHSPEDFFESRILSDTENTWEPWLGPLVSELPPFGNVLSEVKLQIYSILRDK